MSATSSNETTAVDERFTQQGNPYMKYVDQHLKTKGLRKTMAFLQRLIRGPLRRAKTALERPSAFARGGGGGGQQSSQQLHHLHNSSSVSSSAAQGRDSTKLVGQKS
jgi:hypothetical protein